MEGTKESNSRDATSWNFLGAMWAPELKILGAHKKIYEQTMKYLEENIKEKAQNMIYM